MAAVIPAWSLPLADYMSDEDLIEEAIRNGMDAPMETIAALENMELPVPKDASSEIETPWTTQQYRTR